MVTFMQARYWIFSRFCTFLDQFDTIWAKKIAQIVTDGCDTTEDWASNSLCTVL